MLYYANPYRTHSLGADRTLICTGYDIRPVLATNGTVPYLLALCRGARTIEDHAVAIHAATGASVAQAREALRELHRAGLLRAINHVTSTTRLRKSSITAIGIPTADRPRPLRRALKGALRHVAEVGRRVCCFVFDGSRSPTNQSASRACVRAAVGHEQAQKQIVYIGPREAVGIGKWLAKQIGAPRSLQVAVGSGSPGSHRNLLLLLSAGANALMVDDDIEWTTWQSAAYKPGVIVGGHVDLREHRYFATRAQALAAIEERHANLLNIHEEWLGLTLSDIVSDRPELSQACGHILSLLDRTLGGPVRITMTGLAGDSGTYCPYTQLFSNGPKKTTLASSGDTFSLALSSREVHRVATNVIITHDTMCMAGCFALANTTPLPPFTWIGRNEDGVFGEALGATQPDSLFAHLPWGILHMSERDSAWPTDPAVSATETRLCDVLIAVIRLVSGPRVPVADSGQAILARALIDLGRISAREFQLFVRDTVLQRRVRQIAKLDQMIQEDSTCPEYWRRTAARYVSDLVQSLEKRDFFCPAEFNRKSQSFRAGFKECQSFVRQFGELLLIWPEAWQHCRRTGADEIIAQAQSAP